MKKENRRPWWTWTPDLPRPAILVLALFIDLVVLSGLAYALYGDGFALITLLQDLNNPKLPEEIEKQLFTGHFFPRFIGILTLIQLNTEVPTMILTLARQRRQQEAKKAEGHAAGKTEGNAEGQAQANAQARAWYEAWQKDPANAPPPPFLDDHKNGS